MIAKKDWELIKAIKNHKCCGENGGSSDNEQGGGNTPSGDITIDDVVKFIHDEMAKIPFLAESFPYTTWNDIPNYDDANDGDYCKSKAISNQMSFGKIVLNIPNYAIIQKGEPISPVG